MRTIFTLLCLAAANTCRRTYRPFHGREFPQRRDHGRALYASEDQYKLWKSCRKRQASGFRRQDGRLRRPAQGQLRGLGLSGQEQQWRARQKPSSAFRPNPTVSAATSFSRLGAPDFDKAALAIGDDKLETMVDLQ